MTNKELLEALGKGGKQGEATPAFAAKLDTPHGPVLLIPDKGTPDEMANAHNLAREWRDRGDAVLTFGEVVKLKGAPKDHVAKVVMAKRVMGGRVESASKGDGDER
jgi:hypothetical protein